MVGNCTFCDKQYSAKPYKFRQTLEEIILMDWPLIMAWSYEGSINHEKKKVRAAVKRKFPDIGKSK